MSHHPSMSPRQAYMGGAGRGGEEGEWHRQVAGQHGRQQKKEGRWWYTTRSKKHNRSHTGVGRAGKADGNGNYR